MIELRTFVKPVGRPLLRRDLDHVSVCARVAELGAPFGDARPSIGAVAAGPRQITALGFERSIDPYRGMRFAVTIDGRMALPRAGVGLTVVGGAAS